MGATCHGGGPATPTRSSFPSSCFSKPESPLSSLIIMSGFAASPIFRPSRLLRNPAFSTAGRDWVTTPERVICMLSQKSSSVNMAERCRTRSTISARFRASAVTRRTPSRHLRSIDPFHWSKQTSRASWRVCSTCAIRSTQPEAAKQFGIAPSIFSPSAEQRRIIPRSWTSVRSSARPARRSVGFVR